MEPILGLLPQSASMQSDLPAPWGRPNLRTYHPLGPFLQFWQHLDKISKSSPFLASQDALEVILVTYLLTD